MKIIFLNKAVKSYVHFISDLLENPSDKKLNHQYLSLINWYYKYKANKDFMRDLFLITENWDFNNNNFKIYYIEITQLWAYIQLAVEKNLKREKRFDLKKLTVSDIEVLESAFKRMWAKKDAQIIYIYLEDENNKVDYEIKLRNFQLLTDDIETNCKKARETGDGISSLIKLTLKEMNKLFD